MLLLDSDSGGREKRSWIKKCLEQIAGLHIPGAVAGFLNPPFLFCPHLGLCLEFSISSLLFLSVITGAHKDFKGHVWYRIIKCTVMDFTSHQCLGVPQGTLEFEHTENGFIRQFGGAYLLYLFVQLLLFKTCFVPDLTPGAVSEKWRGCGLCSLESSLT